MSRLGAFLIRKTSPADKPTQASKDELDLDEELFSTIGAQLGSDNEALRNLLLDANHKIGELDAIKNAVGKLVDPVTKALAAFEAEKTEKLGLQAVLNNTRTAYGKLRNEVSDLEKKAAKFEHECLQLRQDFAAAQSTARALEAVKTELTVDLAARRSQVADIETRLQYEITEANSLRDENRRLDERVVAADKRNVQIENDLSSARQKRVQSEDEKRALQASVDKTISECSRLSRRLAESENSLAATQGRLRQIEANFIEVNNQRARIAAAHDELKERHESDLATQRMRFEALQSRAAAGDKLLIEARDQLMARAEEMRGFDRRVSELTQERNILETKLSEFEAGRIRRESEITELEQERLNHIERSSALSKSLSTKGSALARAEETIQTLNDRIALLESQMETSRQVNENERVELQSALRREKMERAVIEGALETGRKDFAKLMRDVMALQRQKSDKEPSPAHKSANAA